MPVFKFDNWWLDGNFHPVNDSDSSDNGDSSSSGPSKPVFSGYAVIFLVLSLVLTGITVHYYFVAKNLSVEDPNENDREKHGKAQTDLPTAIKAATRAAMGPAAPNTGGIDDTSTSSKFSWPGSIGKKLGSRFRRLKLPSLEPLKQRVKSLWRKPAVLGTPKSWFARLLQASRRPRGNAGGSPV